MTFCHCIDCKRITGSPLPAFAAFNLGDIVFSPSAGQERTYPTGVHRWSCDQCGSLLAAQFPYLEGQTYVPLGLIDQAADLPPTLHCHADAAMPWLPKDDLPRSAGSGRNQLRRAKT
ncbi:GFA family protein [Shimia ponticola]|uniref:GFA family protein n=1 Tax=Shimia ponticola TaxID=2582893 RepID=UPI0021040262|nr:GFA family protein [Shimia ponticola]